MKNNKSKWSFIKPTKVKIIIFILLLVFFNPATLYMETVLVSCDTPDCDSGVVYLRYHPPWNPDFTHGLDMSIMPTGMFVSEFIIPFIFFIIVNYIIASLLSYVIVKLLNENEN